MTTRWTSGLALAFVLVLAATGTSRAVAVSDHLDLTLNTRLRGEFADWFRPSSSVAANNAQHWGFFASRVRVGGLVTFPHVKLHVELQDTRLVGLPDDGVGLAGAYYAHTAKQDQGETFLKRAVVTLNHSGFTLGLGRFEFSDGLETMPEHPTLAWLTRARIRERLVGPFGFTHVSRSFDGGRVAYDDANWNVTLAGMVPTRGGFEVSANRQLSDVALAYGALTRKSFDVGPPVSLRLFYLFYHDDRDDAVKTDNRPLATRALDGKALSIHTIGGHAITAIEAGPGIIDGLLWVALQTGDWGRQDHSASAYAIEGGYKLPKVFAAPWLRVGYNQGSGDDSPTGDRHETFFQVLPTARIYARTPFFNLMNSSDVFTELMLRPHDRVTIRTDYHWLGLSESNDLWYAGGGASNDEIFGFSGTPSGRDNKLASLVDVSVDVKVTKYVGLGLYYGRAFGESVVRNTFSGSSIDYGYVQMTFRY